MSKEPNKFLQGYICAVTTIIHRHKEVDVATKEAYQAGVGNLTFQELQDAGIDEHDLNILRKYWQELTHY